jgi:hypothetical protein
MYHSVVGTAMPGVFDLRNVLELVDDGLDNRPFTQQEFIREMYQLVFYIRFELGNQLDTL